MNKMQKKKEKLQDKHNELKYEYGKLQNEYNSLNSKKNDHLINSLYGFMIGIPMLIAGIYNSEQLYLILSGGIISLSIAFGFPAYKKDIDIENKQGKIKINMNSIYKNIVDIEKEIQSIKTIDIKIVSVFTLDNCFHTVLQFMDYKESSILIGIKQYINNYMINSIKIKKMVSNEYRSYLYDTEYEDIEYDEKIEIQEIIMPNIIFIYIEELKKILYILCSEEGGIEKFIKDNVLTPNGVMIKNIIKKLSVIEDEYTT